jgi:hypothetical protein
MPRIQLRQLQAGQKLAKDALNAYGRLLLKAGTTIDERHLEILRTWGIVEVDIAGTGAEPNQSDVSFTALPEVVKEQINQRLMEQFKLCNLHHPLLKELILYQRTRLTKQYLKSGG